MQVSNEEARYEENEDLSYDMYDEFMDMLMVFAE